MAQLRFLGPQGDEEVDLGQDLAEDQASLGGDEAEPYTGASREVQDYIRQFITPENELATRDRAVPRDLARIAVDTRPNEQEGQEGPKQRAYEPIGPGGYGRNPRADSAPQQSMEPEPAEQSITSGSPQQNEGFEPFEPLPSPMSNPVVLRQLTTPALPAGGQGLFGKAGGLQGGGLDIGRSNVSGSTNPTALLEMILSSLQR